MKNCDRGARFSAARVTGRDSVWRESRGEIQCDESHGAKVVAPCCSGPIGGNQRLRPAQYVTMCVKCGSFQFCLQYCCTTTCVDDRRRKARQPPLPSRLAIGQKAISGLELSRCQRSLLNGRIFFCRRDAVGLFA